MAVIQLLGRWSSRAIERYTQSAPLALAPSAPSHALAGGRWRAGGRGTVGCPARLGRRHIRGGSGRRARLSGVQFVPAVRPERAVPEADRGPEHFIYLARTRRVHKPDPDEANADRAAWRAVGCGWPYGGRQFFRLSAPPRRSAVAASRRGWRAAARPWRVRRLRPPTFQGSSPSSHRASLTSESGGSTSES